MWHEDEVRINPSGETTIEERDNLLLITTVLNRAEVQDRRFQDLADKQVAD